MCRQHIRHQPIDVVGRPRGERAVKVPDVIAHPLLSGHVLPLVLGELLV
jgi:hypothetical protein